QEQLGDGLQAYWDVLKGNGYIDDKGILQDEFLALKKYDEMTLFKRDGSKVSDDIVMQIYAVIYKKFTANISYIQRDMSVNKEIRPGAVSLDYLVFEVMAKRGILNEKDKKGYGSLFSVMPKAVEYMYKRKKQYDKDVDGFIGWCRRFGTVITQMKREQIMPKQGINKYPFYHFRGGMDEKTDPVFVLNDENIVTLFTAAIEQGYDIEEKLIVKCSRTADKVDKECQLREIVENIDNIMVDNDKVENMYKGLLYSVSPETYEFSKRVWMEEKSSTGKASFVNEYSHSQENAKQKYRTARVTGIIEGIVLGAVLAGLIIGIGITASYFTGQWWFVPVMVVIALVIAVRVFKWRSIDAVRTFASRYKGQEKGNIKYLLRKYQKRNDIFVGQEGSKSGVGAYYYQIVEWLVNPKFWGYRNPFEILYNFLSKLISFEGIASLVLGIIIAGALGFGLFFIAGPFSIPIGIIAGIFIYFVMRYEICPAVYKCVSKITGAEKFKDTYKEQHLGVKILLDMAAGLIALTILPYLFIKLFDKYKDSKEKYNAEQKTFWRKVILTTLIYTLITGIFIASILAPNPLLILMFVVILSVNSVLSFLSFYQLYTFLEIRKQKGHKKDTAFSKIMKVVFDIGWIAVFGTAFCITAGIIPIPIASFFALLICIALMAGYKAFTLL
ncbi:hypothetical protein ACFL4S_02075, partial [bacterium]